MTCDCDTAVRFFQWPGPVGHKRHQGGNFCRFGYESCEPPKRGRVSTPSLSFALSTNYFCVFPFRFSRESIFVFASLLGQTKVVQTRMVQSAAFGFGRVWQFEHTSSSLPPGSLPLNGVNGNHPTSEFKSPSSTFTWGKGFAWNPNRRHVEPPPTTVKCPKLPELSKNKLFFWGSCCSWEVSLQISFHGCVYGARKKSTGACKKATRASNKCPTHV